MGETDIFQRLESTSFAEYIRHSQLLYPIIEIVHIAGFVVLVGSAFVFDLRLLGMSKHIPVTQLARHTLPWSRWSLALVIPSGFALFMTQAGSLSHNRIFGIKLLLIIFALINAGYFHRYTYQAIHKWDHLQPTPTLAKTAGIISIILWTGVITCGRFLAYLE